MKTILEQICKNIQKRSLHPISKTRLACDGAPMKRKDLNLDHTYGINSHKKKAVKLLHEKVRTSDGFIVEYKVWRVSKCSHYPEGVKYSFFAVLRGEILVGYDNHRPKGHHRHFLGREEFYSFLGLVKLKKDFLEDLSFIRKWSGQNHGT